MRLILASASPRRLDLLARIGVVPDEVVPAEIDETPRKGELPIPYARRIAAAKAHAVPSDRHPGLACPGEGRGSGSMNTDSQVRRRRVHGC
jgi:septum formation protein